MSNHKIEAGGDALPTNTEVISFTTNTDISSSGYNHLDYYSAEPVAEADITLTIPDSATLGKRIQVCLGLAGSVTITSESGESLNGTSSQIISVAGKCITLQDRGASNGYTLVQDSRPDPTSTAVAFYALDDESGISTYNETALDINDARINAVEQLSDTVTVTGADISLIEFITDPGAIVGAVPAGPVEITARLKQISGAASSAYYVELHHRDNVGSETLLGTSDDSAIIGIITVESITVSLEIEETQVAADEFLVAKYFLNKVGVGVDPVVEIYTEGVNALARGVIGIPITSLPHNSLPSKQGGVAGEYYHLTSAQEAEIAALVTAGGYDDTGTWDPTISAVTPGDFAATYTTKEATWGRIGKFIIARFDVRPATANFTTTTGSGNFLIENLPFAADGHWAGAFFNFGRIPLGAYTACNPSVANSGSDLTLRKIGDDANAASVQIGDPIVATVILTGALIYKAA